MTITIRLRLPAWPMPAVAGPGWRAAGMPCAAGCGQAETAAVRQAIRLLLLFAEPAAQVLTDAAGLGFIGRLLVPAAIRAARQAIDA